MWPQTSAFTLILLCVLNVSVAVARPVSFKGSTMVMSTSQPMQTTLTADHTFWRQLSLGLTYQWLNPSRGPADFFAPEVNLLLLRHNAADWQGNVFITGALGGWVQGGRLTGAGLVGIEADAESRRWYVLAGARYLRSFQTFENLQVMGRVGLAPFLAEYDQISPWVVLQYQYMPGFQSSHVVTPMVRLLYQGMLIEVGASLRGEWTVNFSAEL